MKPINLIVPLQIQEIILTLSQSFEVYLVGGCVRDYLLDKEIHDFDCTTNATVDEMKEILHMYKIIETGIKHGTLTILNQGFSVEITTYRIDKNYLNHRFPSHVEFTRNIHEDLKRRDFTINALACDLNGLIIDDHHGLDDIKNKIIRCVGNPMIRFEEDALRILRAIRFSCTLDFEIEENTKQAIFQSFHLLRDISIERKRDEFFKILVSRKEIYSILQSYPVLSMMNIPIHSCIQEIDQKECDLEIRIASLFNSKKLATQILKSWHCSNKLMKRIGVLVESSHDDLHQRYMIRKLIYIHGSDFTRKILLFNQMDLSIYHQILEQHDYIDQLAINGTDLIELGYQKKEIQEGIQQCLDLVFRDISLNDKEYLLKKMRK